MAGNPVTYLQPVPDPPDQDRRAPASRPPSGRPARPADGGGEWWRVQPAGQTAGGRGPSGPDGPADADFRSASSPVPPDSPPGATGPAAGPGQPGPAGPPAAAPGGELELYGAGMNGGERAARLLRHWASMTVANAARPGGLGHGITAGRPASVRLHLQYVKRRDWVPEGHPGGLIGPAGVIYGRTIGVAGVAAGNWLTWTFERPMRLIFTAVLAGLLIMIVALCA